MTRPESFLWGCSISASQAEGGWNENGKSPVQVDFGTTGSPGHLRSILYRNKDGVFAHTGQFESLPEGASYDTDDTVYYPNRTASDFCNHCREDIRLAAELGINAFNTTVSWARLFPGGIGNGVNPAGVRFYRQLFTECVNAGIEPVITLYKYDEPIWYEEQFGSWKSRKMIDEFTSFALFCIREYKDLVHTWITFNEINVRSLPGSDPIHLTEVHHQMVASARVVREAHAMDPSLRIGCMAAGICAYPRTCAPDDVLAAQQFEQEALWYYTDTVFRGHYPAYAENIQRRRKTELCITKADREDLKHGIPDFLSVSYYSSSTVSRTAENEDMVSGNLVTSVRNPYLEASEWGWQIDPTGLRILLSRLYERYEVPILVGENGLGAEDAVTEEGRVHDPYRIDYLSRHIQSLREAQKDGADVMGYIVWSLIDVISFSTGQMEKRYGLIYVDRDDHGNGTFARIPKDSFHWYQNLIRTHRTNSIQGALQ